MNKEFLFNDGVFWGRTIGDGQVALGLTRDALKRFGQIWNLVPKKIEGDRVDVNTNLAQIETLNCLKSLKCPIRGTLDNITSVAIERPDSITEKSVLFTIKDVSIGTINALPSL